MQLLKDVFNNLSRLGDSEILALDYRQKVWLIYRLYGEDRPRIKLIRLMFTDKNSAHPLNLPDQ
jgi:hypothetical protein